MESTNCNIEDEIEDFFYDFDKIGESLNSINENVEINNQVKNLLEKNVSDHNVEHNNPLGIVSNLLYNNSQTTIYQSVLAIMNFFIRHKLTRAALKELLKILQVLLPETNNMPKTDFQLFRMIDKAVPPCNFIKHYYCKKMFILQ